jgi:glycosidase
MNKFFYARNQKTNLQLYPDFGYDISNYTDIQPEYGTVQDVEDLVKVCKQLGIKLILDFVPNHTSNQVLNVDKLILFIQLS